MPRLESAGDDWFVLPRDLTPTDRYGNRPNFWMVIRPGLEGRVRSGVCSPYFVRSALFDSRRMHFAGTNGGGRTYRTCPAWPYLVRVSPPLRDNICILGHYPLESFHRHASGPTHAHGIASWFCAQLATSLAQNAQKPARQPATCRFPMDRPACPVHGLLTHQSVSKPRGRTNQPALAHVARGLLRIILLDGKIDVREGVGKCSYRREESIRDRRPTAENCSGINPQPRDRRSGGLWRSGRRSSSYSQYQVLVTPVPMLRALLDLRLRSSAIWATHNVFPKFGC